MRESQAAGRRSLPHLHAGQAQGGVPEEDEHPHGAQDNEGDDGPGVAEHARCERRHHHDAVVEVEVLDVLADAGHGIIEPLGLGELPEHLRPRPGGRGTQVTGDTTHYGHKRSAEVALPRPPLPRALVGRHSRSAQAREAGLQRLQAALTRTALGSRPRCAILRGERMVVRGWRRQDAHAGWAARTACPAPGSCTPPHLEGPTPIRKRTTQDGLALDPAVAFPRLHLRNVSRRSTCPLSRDRVDLPRPCAQSASATAILFDLRTLSSPPATKRAGPGPRRARAGIARLSGAGSLLSDI